jgi:hypothetical protein
MINDVMFHILLVMMLTWNLKAKVVNIETASLHGDLKETIYMEITNGMEASVDECLILNKDNLLSCPECQRALQQTCVCLEGLWVSG